MNPSIKKLPSVVLVGRINVGKSSLFNRLTESTKALVSRVEGTTRDYNMGMVNWRRKTFEIIDTGGVNINILKNSIQDLVAKKKNKDKPDQTIEKEIITQTKEALKKAKVVIMMVDGKTGLLPEDKELALVLKKLKIPIVLVCNKIDTLKQRSNINDFYKLGLNNPYPVSASNGSGVGDFLDELIKIIKWPPGRPKIIIEEDDSIKVAMVGKPNAGKSSLVNQILGEKRVIVSPTPQTTREPQDTFLTYKNQKITLIDTAGLKKKAKINAGLDRMASRKSLDMARSADVVIFVTEGDKELTRQDAALAGLAKDASAAIIIVANKWDLIEDKDTHSDKTARALYKARFPFLSFAPIIFTSALTGKNVDKILDLITDVYNEKTKEISDEDLENLLETIIRRHKPAQAKGTRPPHIYGLKQTRANPPEFTATIRTDDTIHFSYIRFIENQIREKFGFEGVPIRIIVREIKQ